MSSLHTKGSGALSAEDLEALRGMVLRRQTIEAESWLVAHGFQRDRAKQIVFEQEMEVANAIYHAPVLAYLVIAVVAFSVAGFLYGAAMDVQPDERDIFFFKGRQRDIAIAAMVALPLLVGAFF